MSSPKKKLKLILHVSDNECGGLYDYSLNNKYQNLTPKYISKRSFLIKNSINAILIRNNHSEIRFKEGESLIFFINLVPPNDFLLINSIPKYTHMTKENNENLNNKIWYVIKSNDISKKEIENEVYYLTENDIIKFGKMKLLVKKINFTKKKIIANIQIDNEDAPKPINQIEYNIDNSDAPPVLDNIFVVENYENFFDINEKISDNSQIPKDKRKCRLCDKFSNEKEKEKDSKELNPLINLCNCKEKIHFKCLKGKILESKEKIEIKSPIFEYNYYKNYECDICKYQYPSSFKLKGKETIFNLYEIKEPKDTDYMILESIDYLKDDIAAKIVIIIKLLKDVISIGRNNENDIILNDISVSKFHSVLKYDKLNGKINILNLSKKFGTLVLVRKPIKMLDKAIYLQVGKYFIEAILTDKEDA